MTSEEKLDGRLLDNIKEALPRFRELQGEMDDHWGYEDGIYRFYHQSFKVYRLQSYTERVVEEMRAVDPRPSDKKEYYSRTDCEFHPLFEEIIKAGTGIEFHVDHNSDWSKWTRPIVEAYMHTNYMLKMMIKYGDELDEPTDMLPSGWAAVLYIYGLR